MPTCLYFVCVDGVLDKFGTTTDSVETRGKKGAGKSRYTKTYFERWLPRKISLPVEKVLLELTRDQFDAAAAVRAGLWEWGGWTETRTGLDVDFWKSKILELIDECSEIGYQKFLVKYVDQAFVLSGS